MQSCTVLKCFHVSAFKMITIWICLAEGRLQNFGSNLLLGEGVSVTVCFQMHPQIECKRRCEVTFAAFVSPFLAVCLQMCPQIVCKRRWIVTLVAFVRLFSIVYFQMSPQITCTSWYIVTLVATDQPFSTVCFQMCPQSNCLSGCIITLVAFVDFVGFYKASHITHIVDVRSWFHYQLIKTKCCALPDSCFKLRQT